MTRLRVVDTSAKMVQMSIFLNETTIFVCHSPTCNFHFRQNFSLPSAPLYLRSKKLHVQYA